MGAPLTDDEPDDLCATGGAGFSCAVIHPKMVLEFTAAIDPINGSAVATDTFPQYFADRFMQRLSLFRRYRIGRGAWMQFCNVQNFIGVNVAQPGEERLIEKQRLELAVFAVQCSVQPLRGKFPAERFRSESAEHFIWIGCEPHTSEFTRVIEDERSVIR